MSPSCKCIAIAAILATVGEIGVQADAQPRNNFRFAILGDRTGNADEPAYEEIWREIGREHPDFVMNVGDLIEGGHDATAESEWSQLRRAWEHYQLPVYLTPGNHDIWSEPSRRIFEKEAGHPLPYSFDFQDAHFIVLDNSASLDLDDRQMQFLEADLRQNQDRHPKFVFFHQPFWLIPLKFQSSDFPFHRLARKYGVDCVFSGHDHQLVRIVRDGIVYLEAGSSGGKLKGEGFEKGWFYQHALARVAAARVDITIKEIDPPFGSGRSFDAANWGDHGLKSGAPH